MPLFNWTKSFFVRMNEKSFSSISDNSISQHQLYNEQKKRCSIAQKHKFSSNYELPWMKSNCQRCKMACIWLAVIWFMLLSDFVWVLVEEYGLLHAIIMYSSWVKHMRITFLLWNNAWKCKLCNQLFCQWLCQCFGNIHQKKNRDNNPNECWTQKRIGQLHGVPQSGTTAT